MLFLICAGIIAFFFGIMFLFFPQQLRQLEKKTNKVLVATEEKVYNLRVGIGISFVVVSILCFFVTYYLFKKYC